MASLHKVIILGALLQSGLVSSFPGNPSSPERSYMLSAMTGSKCPALADSDVEVCFKVDPCCNTEPVFVNGCFRGCKKICQRKYNDCSNTCEPPPRYNILECVNSDPLCSVRQLNSSDMNGRSCFYGCILLCA